MCCVVDWGLEFGLEHVSDKIWVESAVCGLWVELRE